MANCITPIDIVEISLMYISSVLYKWSEILTAGSSLKKAVDYVLCSICHIKPTYFTYIVQWSGVCVESTAEQNQHVGGMTDDSKEAFSAAYLEELSNMRINNVNLATLATVCQSPTALQQLLSSRLPALLCQGLLEFCNNQNQLYSNWLMCMHQKDDMAPAAMNVDSEATIPQNHRSSK